MTSQAFRASLVSSPGCGDASWTWLTRVDRDDLFQTQSVSLRTEPTGRLRSVKVIILSHVPAVPGCSDAGAGDTEGRVGLSCGW